MTGRANLNLLGFRPLGSRRPEAKAVAYNHDISTDTFRESFHSTGINIDFVKTLSSLLATKSTFKVETALMSTLGDTGSHGLLIPLRPNISAVNVVSSLDVEVVPTSAARDDVATFGIGLFLASEVWKENRADGPIATATNNWCCLTSSPDHMIPDAWYHNRNIRRNLPDTWYSRNFTGSTQTRREYLRLVIDRMVATKRS